MTKKDAKSAAKTVIKANPTWSDERVWAALKEDGHDPEDRALISDARYELGAKKDSWTKEDE